MAAKRRPPPPEVNTAVAKARQAQRESEQRAREFQATAPRCTVCGQLIATRGRTKHFLCDAESTAGKACVCAPGCTDQRYGDGRVPCDVACVPCRLQRGQLYTPPRRG